jgi:TPP-dependent pyruvate/acetoin dehydrogenase alpha subunit
MPSERIEDMDIFKIYESAKKNIARIRKGSGPVFLECLGYRWKEHVGPGTDFHLGYRKEEEAACWIKNDQLEAIRKLLEVRRLKEVESEVEHQIKEAFEYAEEGSFPGNDALWEDLFKE